MQGWTATTRHGVTRSSKEKAKKLQYHSLDFCKEVFIYVKRFQIYSDNGREYIKDTKNKQNSIYNKILH